MDSPERRLRRLPREVPAGRRGQELLRAEDVQPLRALAVRPGVPGRRDLRVAGRRRAGRQELLPRLPLLRAGLPLRLPLHRPAHLDRGQVHALLPPHHARAHHRLLRDLPHRGAGARRPEGPQGPDPRVPAHAQGPGAQAADGHRVEGLLQRLARSERAARMPGLERGAGTSGPIGRAIASDGASARRRGLHVPERDGAPVEHPDRALSLHHRPGRGRLHPGLARARVPGRGGQADLPAGAAHGARVPAGGAAAAAAPPRPPRALARDVPDAAHLVGDGDVRLRLPLVPDGGAGARDLARLPARDRAAARAPRPGRCATSTAC